MNASASTPVRLRSTALVGATITLGISWSWAAAMPLLATYYATRASRAAWKHLPAAALSLYALVLWRISGSYGLLGGVSLGLGIASSLAVLWLGARWNRPALSAVTAPSAAASPRLRRRTRAARRRPA
jgi:hypothetical protein